ncbi:MAG: hypothetical protein NTY19_08530 [Planctomycetota bacterium]|nr:hypothetical protein [Planctomycetota bacterium]
MKRFASCIFLVLAALILLDQRTATAVESPVIAYPFPVGPPTSNWFHVTVDGQPVFTRAAEVADFAMFAIRGPVQVTVACEQPVTGAIVRPRSRNIVPQWEGKTVRFPADFGKRVLAAANQPYRPRNESLLVPSALASRCCGQTTRTGS